jgi:hypothetical protein
MRVGEEKQIDVEGAGFTNLAVTIVLHTIHFLTVV